MPEWLSVTSASRRYLISEKTIRNWIRDGLLIAGKVRVNGKMQYSIDPAHLEEVMKERNMTVIPKPDKTAEEMQDKINRLERSMEVLAKRISQLEQDRYSTIDYRIPEPPAPLEGTMDTHEFAVLHNLNINQVQSVVGEAKYIGKAGMRRVWEKYHEVKRFHGCDSCPHGEG